MLRSKEFWKTVTTAAILIAVTVLLLVWAFGSGTVVTKIKYVMDADEYENNAGLFAPQEKDTLYGIEVTPESLSGFLSAFTLPNDTYWATSHYDAVNNIRYTCEYRLKGDRERIDCYREGRLFYSYIFSPQATLTYHVDMEKPKIEYWESYDSLSFAYMQAYSDLRSIDAQNVRAVSFTSLSNQNMLYVEYTDDKPDTVYKCWVSLKSGVPIVFETYVNGERTEYTTTTAYEIKVEDPIIFRYENYLES